MYPFFRNTAIRADVSESVIAPFSDMNRQFYPIIRESCFLSTQKVVAKQYDVRRRKIQERSVDFHDILYGEERPGRARFEKNGPGDKMNVVSTFSRLTAVHERKCIRMSGETQRETLRLDRTYRITNPLAGPSVQAILIRLSL